LARFDGSWDRASISAKRYVYFWAEVHARLEDDAQCLLVIIGATPEGKKELVGLTPHRSAAADNSFLMTLAAVERASSYKLFLIK
jgi:hypothetical protein